MSFAPSATSANNASFGVSHLDAALPTTGTFHPLDPLSPQEIRIASAAFRTELLRRGVRSVKSTYVDLIEPPKAEVIAYLGLATSPTDLNPKSSGIKPKRRAEASLIDTLSGQVYVLACEIKNGQGHIDSFEEMPEGIQPAITMEELVESEEVVRNHPEVIRLCAEVGISQEQIMCDCWSIGYEHRFGKNRRLQQAFIYARTQDHDHLYAHPMDFNVVVDSNAKEVLKIDFASHRTNPNNRGGLSGSTIPHVVEGDSLKDSGRARIPPPLESHDYLPDLIADKAKKEGKTWDVRRDLKPLHVQQPLGVSFSMDGNRLKWQNWDMHIGYNYREGIVLNAIQYFDKDQQRYRPIMYRASFAEMVVPYAAPEWPHPRKFAFDVGEYGLGMMANSLALGCDCLGAIHYLDATMSDHSGQPTTLARCVCIHEEDDGLLWKHTDFRPNGRAHSVRSRKLIIQFIATVANYEYLFAWAFKQDGTMELEIKLTGILNTYLLAEGEKCAEYGTEVAPRIQAHHHQHIFCLRLDPMIDGVTNSVTETEIVPDAAPTGSAENWAGNGFHSTKKYLDNTLEGSRDANPFTGRMWSMVNENATHYSSGAPAGYKIMCKDFPPLLAQPDSLIGRRATFAKKNLWVTPYVDGQLFPAGKFPTQTWEAPEDSLEGWMAKGSNIRKTDVVTWVTFGVTHLPRPEDFPVMPYEHVTIQFKPTNFFKSNPSLDVPSGTDLRSVSAFEKKDTCCGKL
ncbi:copper amine oxidase [Leucosporidium creatinivorum]|uniref:Amine oxidase n=1 Tax=Leucosporidium creatinivorum TaxID=106004 RepID=A0A1Y2ENI0_9BASI|nr:copper amine oxidase [Leucosporidium creatinivorum]